MSSWTKPYSCDRHMWAGSAASWEATEGSYLPTCPPSGRPAGRTGSTWHRASSQPCGRPWRTLGKVAAQSVARYWYTRHVRPKSEDRSMSSPAGCGPYGERQVSCRQEEWLQRYWQGQPGQCRAPHPRWGSSLAHPHPRAQIASSRVPPPRGIRTVSVAESVAEQKWEKGHSTSNTPHRHLEVHPNTLQLKFSIQVQL